MQLNGLNVSILCGDPPEKMEEYPYTPQYAGFGDVAKGIDCTECWIASTSGTKFSISWGSADALYTGKKSDVLACSVFMDGVFTERGLLFWEDFKNEDHGRISGYSLDAHSELPFCFEERNPNDFTSNPYHARELNTIAIELEWCRIHNEHTIGRPLGGELPAFSLGPISASTGPAAHGDTISLGLPELSETYLWYETIPAKLRRSKFIFHYMPKGEWISQASKWLLTYLSYDAERLIQKGIIPNPDFDEEVVEAPRERLCLKRKRDRAPSPEENKSPIKPARKAKPCIMFQLHEDDKLSIIEHPEPTKPDEPVLPLIASEVDPWRLGC